MLTSIADSENPTTSVYPTNSTKPWFYGDCDQAINIRKKSERQFYKRPTSGNLGDFRIYFNVQKYESKD